MLAFLAAPCSCARPIVVQFYPEPQRSRRDVALVMATSGSGDYRVDVIEVDERGTPDPFLVSDPVWIEVPPGNHVFEVALALNRSRSGAVYAEPMGADVEGGRCYRPALGPRGDVDWWGERHLEVISCPATWRWFPRQVRKASEPPEGL